MLYFENTCFSLRVSLWLMVLPNPTFCSSSQSSSPRSSSQCAGACAWTVSLPGSRWWSWWSCWGWQEIWQQSQGDKFASWYDSQDDGDSRALLSIAGLLLSSQALGGDSSGSGRSALGCPILLKILQTFLS